MWEVAEFGLGSGLCFDGLVRFTCAVFECDWSDCLIVLSMGPSHRVARAVAADNRIGPSVANRLVTNPDSGVRAALAGNLATPASVVSMLMSDSDRVVRASACRQEMAVQQSM